MRDQCFKNDPTYLVDLVKCATDFAQRSKMDIAKLTAACNAKDDSDDSMKALEQYLGSVCVPAVCISHGPTPACKPNCAGKGCGPDGCGGVCGVCGGKGSSCVNGNCTGGKKHKKSPVFIALAVIAFIVILAVLVMAITHTSRN
jgi:hypothetical protein